jgi:hypothetical protein
MQIGNIDFVFAEQLLTNLSEQGGISGRRTEGPGVLQLRAEAAELHCDWACLGKLILEGVCSAEGNPSRDDYIQP